MLKQVSAGHPNIVQLHDFFETTHNLYVGDRPAQSTVGFIDSWQLVFDLCTGGELFDRICARGSYFEKLAIVEVYGRWDMYTDKQTGTQRISSGLSFLPSNTCTIKVSFIGVGGVPYRLVLLHFVIRYQCSTSNSSNS